MLGGLLMSAVLVAAASAQSPVCKDGWFQNGTRCYYYDSVPRTRSNAIAECYEFKRGATLALFDSRAQMVAAAEGAGFVSGVRSVRAPSSKLIIISF
jgi:hypothetical protein